jgi:cyclophilin family peptidyl-prolyl cis-trans isomerase/HEAT repeat protein
MMQKLSWYIIFILIVSLSCNQIDKKVIQEIQQQEYLRDTNPENFVAWLNSPDEDIRAQALKSLGRIQDTSTISWMANRLADKSVKVRKEAAFALGQTFSPKSFPALNSAISFEEDKKVKTQLLEALGKTADQDLSRLLESYIQGGDPDYQQVAAITAAILSYRGYPPYEAGNSIGQLLGVNDNAVTNWRCAYALYRIGSPSEFGPVFQTLHSNDPLTRFFSLKALMIFTTLMRSPQFEPYKKLESMKEAASLFPSNTFFDSLASSARDTSWFVRVTALQLMKDLKYSQYVKLIEDACSDPSPHVRATALQVLPSYLNSPKSSFLTEFIQNTLSWRDRGIALESLSEIDQAAALKLVKNEILSTEWPENYYYIRVLENIKNAESTKILLSLANSDKNTMVSQILEILVNRKGVPNSLFMEKLEMYDPAITTIVAGKFGQSKNMSAVEPLINAYQKFTAPRDIEPMVAILSALESIGDSKATTLLQQELHNPFPTVRIAALHALERITGKSVELPEVAKQPLTKFDFALERFRENPVVRFTTTKGTFEVELYPEKAPITVANFISLVKTGFYNNLYFHRVVPGFVIQGGDPRGDGWGGPGYAIPCEYNDIFYNRGVLGMAHAGKDTGGSQFFITETPQPHLNGKHTAFGKVLQGMKVVDAIEIYDQILKAELTN